MQWYSCVCNGIIVCVCVCVCVCMCVCVCACACACTVDVESTDTGFTACPTWTTNSIRSAVEVIQNSTGTCFLSTENQRGIYIHVYYV